MVMYGDALQIALVPVIAVVAGSAVGLTVGRLLDWTLMNDSYRRKLAEQDRLIQHYRNEFEKECRPAPRSAACSIGASVPQSNPSESHLGGDEVPNRAEQMAA
jgi:hypothetical protein